MRQRAGRRRGERESPTPCGAKRGVLREETVWEAFSHEMLCVLSAPQNLNEDSNSHATIACVDLDLKATNTEV